MRFSWRLPSLKKSRIGYEGNLMDLPDRVSSAGVRAALKVLSFVATVAAWLIAPEGPATSQSTSGLRYPPTSATRQSG